MSKYMVITNNPLVRSRLDDTHEVIYLELSYEELLKVVKDGERDYILNLVL